MVPQLIMVIIPQCMQMSKLYIIYLKLTQYSKPPTNETFKFRPSKDVTVCPCVHSQKLVHLSGVLHHVSTPSTSGCAPVHFTVQQCIEYSISISSPGCSEARTKAGVMQGALLPGPAASCCTVLLYFSKYCTARLKLVSVCVCLCTVV